MAMPQIGDAKAEAMPVTHINRQNDPYYLHVGKTRSGSPSYWFSKKPEGDLAEAVPEGYEIYESPESQVFLRKIVPRKVTPFEVATVTKGLELYAPGEKCLVDIQGEKIVVYHAEKTEFDPEDFPFPFRKVEFYSRFIKVMQFVLKDKEARTFETQRWCFRGSVDRWIDLWSSNSRGNLPDLVREFLPHIGKESFFELM